MKRISLVLVAFLLVIFTSCKEDNDEANALIRNVSVKGVVQKGPFLNSASIGIFELNNSYSATGKVYMSQIADNSGFFQINNISLKSQYVLLKADGYYFNEISGQTSSAPLTLYALSDITNKTSINVNILSHLEKSRVEFLLSKGIAFSVAKKQAEQEILKIFSITKTNITDSELLNISQDGDDNAVLLAISLITQGFRTESELSDLLANISTDIRQDGVLNSPTLGSLLINDARLLNLPQIRTNLEQRYVNFGMAVTIPDFEKYIKQFVDSSQYVVTNFITYPVEYNSKPNILNYPSLLTPTSTLYSVAAYLPKGTSLKLVFKPSAGYSICGFGFQLGQIVGYTAQNYADSNVFVAVGDNKIVNNIVGFGSWVPTSTDILIYENNSATPTRINVITTN